MVLTKPPLQHLRLKRGGRTTFLGNKWVRDESDRSFPSGAEAEIGQCGLRLRSVPHMSSLCDGKEDGAWR